MLTPELIQTILTGYALSPKGVHGVAHWARVLENGRRLAAASGASLAVVSLFSVFHDSRRENDGSDRDHGLRGAQFAASLRGRLFDLPDEEFNDLFNACSWHTNGETRANINVQVCWDADRLDLFRVGIKPAPKLLCTQTARAAEMLTWANERAQQRMVPDLVRSEWSLFDLFPEEQGKQSWIKKP